MKLQRLVSMFERNKVFTDSEAWLLFRIGAIAEAVGWTLLITGIALQEITGSHIPVLIAGQIHGMLFFGYAAAAAGLYPSLGWSRWQAFCAVAASVPPYGSLLIEQWAHYQRMRRQAQVYSHAMAWTLLAQATDEKTG